MPKMCSSIDMSVVIRLFKMDVYLKLFAISFCVHASHKLNIWPVIRQQKKAKRNQTWNARHQWNMFRCWPFLFASCSTFFFFSAFDFLWKKIKIAEVLARCFFFVALLVTSIWLKWKRITKWLTMVIRAPHAIIQLPCAQIRIRIQMRTQTRNQKDMKL